MLVFEVEFTDRKTPQQNSKAKMAFTVLIAVQVPDLQQFKLWPEVVMTAMFLNYLMPVIVMEKARPGGSMLDTNFLFRSRISKLL
jgi:hypothetical protein